MAGKKLVVFAIYFVPSNVERAINSLINANINAADISVWFSQSLTSREFMDAASYDSQHPPAASSSYLKELGVPASEFYRYEDFIQKGGILLAVRCPAPEESDRARRIMKGCQSNDVSSTSENLANSTDAWR